MTNQDQNKQTTKAEIIRITEVGEPYVNDNGNYQTDVELYIIDNFGRKLERVYTVNTYGKTQAEIGALAFATHKIKASNELTIFTRTQYVAHLFNSRNGKGINFERLFYNLYRHNAFDVTAYCDRDEKTKEKEETI